MAERLIIVRHGETEWSRSGRHTGRTDLPLTGHGREQAAGLRDKLGGVRCDLVLCSPLLRARETCEGAGFGAVAQRCDDLMEWDYGAYEGLTTPEIHERDANWLLWRDGCPAGESPADVRDRVDAVLARVAAIDGTALAFAHGHVLRALTARWLQFDVSAGARFMLEAGSVGVLGWERETAVMERWNA